MLSNKKDAQSKTFTRDCTLETISQQGAKRFHFFGELDPNPSLGTQISRNMTIIALLLAFLGTFTTDYPLRD